MDEPLPSLRPLILRAAVVALLFALAPAVMVWAVPEVQDPVAIRGYLLSFGPLAPLVLVVLQVLQVLVAPIPGAVLAVASGALFGAVPGAVYSLIGTTIGSTIAFALSRRYGRPYVSRLVGPQRLVRFDGFVERTGLPGVFALFLVPGPWPDDMVCFVAGVSTIPIPRLILAAVAGRAPALLFASFLGAELVSGRFALTGFVLGALLLTWVLGYYYRREALALLRRTLGRA
ncbi:MULTISPECIES: TVP38/TMEM64 family protein [Salinibaculum]|uniref:TVP38/TMEM64 family protein n=1 Tax=Salinibaculum TaxID=2732368 RepID=UPI0030CF92AA